MPSYSGGNSWQSSLPFSHRYPYSYRRFYADNRSLSERLWDIESDDDQDEINGKFFNNQNHFTLTRGRLQDFRSSNAQNVGTEDEEEEEEELYNNQKPVFI
jgi:hypothetical protein